MHTVQEVQDYQLHIGTQSSSAFSCSFHGQKAQLRITKTTVQEPHEMLAMRIGNASGHKWTPSLPN